MKTYSNYFLSAKQVFNIHIFSLETRYWLLIGEAGKRSGFYYYRDAVGPKSLETPYPCSRWS